LASLLSFIFNRLISRRKTELEKVIEKQTEAENNLINNRKLIIKKGLTNNFFSDYQQISQMVQKKVNRENFFGSLYKSTFSYLIRFGKFFLLLVLISFIPNANDFIIFTMFTKLTTSFNYLIKGVRKYPKYSSVRKRFGYFLNLPERNDIQKNILVSEPITSIALQRVSFSYEKNEPVLKELNLVFEKGKINHLQAPNGFGKTTIVDLLFGLYQPTQGEIVINSKYKLSEVNLKE
jgi:ABC-type bacteriocin/lantibiotic exporter with double-glycine peptidase domain